MTVTHDRRYLIVCFALAYPFAPMGRLHVAVSLGLN